MRAISMATCKDELGLVRRQTLVHAEHLLVQQEPLQLRRRHGQVLLLHRRSMRLRDL